MSNLASNSMASLVKPAAKQSADRKEITSIMPIYKKIKRLIGQHQHIPENIKQAASIFKMTFAAEKHTWHLTQTDF
ncbi:MAG: hypothetical protein M0P74_14045 [Syntrophales bacterium]|jgi:hypothetical protein|nr:hypothetical protein [Syntrophales bacterium]